MQICQPPLSTATHLLRMMWAGRATPAKTSRRAAWALSKKGGAAVPPTMFLPANPRESLEGDALSAPKLQAGGAVPEKRQRSRQSLFFTLTPTLRSGKNALSPGKNPPPAPRVEPRLSLIGAARLKLRASRRSAPTLGERWGSRKRGSAQVPGSAPALGCTSTRPRGLS